ncbi:MAG: signal recognition particle receptor subunit alpha, partial [Dehalococcoidales bacterium]|nr:signal recognition particle receptor subunit alpha [Dehalococcoidales bacterium]
MGLKDLFKKALKPTKESWFSRAMSLFERTSIDESIWNELEELLISADVGVETTEKLIQNTRQR